MAHWKEARMVPSADGRVVAISRDFTEQRRAEAEQRRLAAEQAALRRVATLVAGNAPPEEVFQTVTEEVCRLLGLRDRGAPPLRGRADVDDRRQVRGADGPLRGRQRRRARGGLGAAGAADRRARPVELRRARRAGRCRAAGARLPRERRRADHGRRRDVGRARRRASAGRDASARDRAPPAGIR